MSLDVFLNFRRCPKHPNTPPAFDFGTPIAYFGNPLPGRSVEIEMRLIGDKVMPKVSTLAQFPAFVDVNTAWDRYKTMRQAQTVLRSAH